MSYILGLTKKLQSILSVIKQQIPQSSAKIARDAELFWSLSDNDSQLRDLSHWRGEGRWSNISAWTEIGTKHFEMFERLCLFTSTRRPISTMVEWGPGGGANAVHFVNEVQTSTELIFLLLT